MEQEILTFVEWLLISLYKWLTERYHLPWLHTLVTMLAILGGLILAGAICLGVWRKARDFRSRVRVWWKAQDFFSNVEAGSLVRRRSLWVLMVMAGWITIVCFVAQRTTRHLFYFVELALTYSLPALLFGGVILWWLWAGKHR
jgi:hypothetical protein